MICGITGKLSGKRSPLTQYQNITTLSAPMMGYTPIASQLFVLSLAIADPLSALNQKTDYLCLPILELLGFAIADPLSALTNLADSFGLLICDRTQIISTDSIGAIATYNGLGFSGGTDS
jgi:hypothetical protein